MSTPTTPAEHWHHASTNSVITMSSDPGKPGTYFVRLATRAPVGSDYLRETHHDSVLGAAERVRYLMELVAEIVPGAWKRAQSAELASIPYAYLVPDGHGKYYWRCNNGHEPMGGFVMPSAYALADQAARMHNDAHHGGSAVSMAPDNPLADVDPAKTERWKHGYSGSTIIKTWDTARGEGFYVQLDTTREVPEELTRLSFHYGAQSANERVDMLKGLIPGVWTIVRNSVTSVPADDQ